MLRVVLTFLAALALLSSPVAAAAAQAACGQQDQAAMAGMDMASSASTAQAAAQKAGDPCCDPAKQTHGGKGDMSCAQACATTCVVVAALAASPIGVVFTPLPTDAPAARFVAPHPYEPPGLKRPPKSIA